GSPAASAPTSRCGRSAPAGPRPRGRHRKSTMPFVGSWWVSPRPPPRSGCASSTAAASSRRTSTRSWRSPTSTGPWSAGRASTPPPSPVSCSTSSRGAAMIGVLINYVVPVIHVLACLFLIVVVLLQTGKGADMGAVFGGGSQTLFGSSGAGNFLTKLTTGTAIAFMLTSLILTWGASRAPSSNLFDRLPAAAGAPSLPPAESEPPAAPAPAPEAGGGAPAGESAPSQ